MHYGVLQLQYFYQELCNSTNDKLTFQYMEDNNNGVTTNLFFQFKKLLEEGKLNWNNIRFSSCITCMTCGTKGW